MEELTLVVIEKIYFGNLDVVFQTILAFSDGHGTETRKNNQGIQYLRFLVLVLSTFGIGIGIGIESIPGLVNGIDPIVNWY